MRLPPIVIMSSNECFRLADVAVANSAYFAAADSVLLYLAHTLEPLRAIYTHGSDVLFTVDLC